MQELARLCRELGCRDVHTYLQSGNVVFTPPPGAVAGLAGRVAAAIESRFGFPAPVVMRTAAEIGAVCDSNPFLEEGADPACCHVAFLADRPAAAAVSRLDPGRSPGDRFRVDGREVFLLLPNGVARSKLTNAWLDAALSTRSTIRNWKTVLALRSLCEAR